MAPYKDSIIITKAGKDLQDHQVQNVIKGLLHSPRRKLKYSSSCSTFCITSSEYPHSKLYIILVLIFRGVT